jgi:threonine synthase
MPRPHEDLERHTAVDHRPGGLPIEFAKGSWFAIDVVNVKAERVDAGISSYETLIEKARTSSAKAGNAIVFRSDNKRRVVALVQVDGHDAFRHLKAAWDDHHLNAEHHAVAESSALALYQLAATAGDASIDPTAKDAYALEHVAVDPAHAAGVTAALSAAKGFRGVLLFGTADATATALVYRFERAEDLDAFRATPAASNVLGKPGAPGESFHFLRVEKTFV